MPVLPKAEPFRIDSDSLADKMERGKILEICNGAVKSPAALKRCQPPFKSDNEGWSPAPGPFAPEIVTDGQ
jgi:hypothetical protein